MKTKTPFALLCALVLLGSPTAYGGLTTLFEDDFSTDPFASGRWVRTPDDDTTFSWNSAQQSMHIAYTTNSGAWAGVPTPLNFAGGSFTLVADVTLSSVPTYAGWELNVGAEFGYYYPSYGDPTPYTCFHWGHGDLGTACTHQWHWGTECLQTDEFRTDWLDRKWHMEIVYDAGAGTNTYRGWHWDDWSANPSAPPEFEHVTYPAAAPTADDLQYIVFGYNNPTVTVTSEGDLHYVRFEGQPIPAPPAFLLGGVGLALAGLVRAGRRARRRKGTGALRI